MNAFNVYLGGRLIDTVFYPKPYPMTCDGVRQSLIGHDGYDYRIAVTKKRV